MKRETGVLIVGFCGLVLVVGFLIVNVGALTWFLPDSDPPKDHGIACVDSDPSNYSNVTYVPFESLDEREQQILEPALREGHVSLTAEQAHAVNHTFIEYENETYLCVGGIS